MSSSPRSGPSQTAIFALAVGALIVGVSVILAAFGVNVLKAGDEFVGGTRDLFLGLGHGHRLDLLGLAGAARGTLAGALDGRVGDE